MLRTRSSVTVGNLVALPLSDREWRIEDPERTEQEGLGLVGFIQLSDDLYEVTRLGQPREWTYFTALADAIQSLEFSRALHERSARLD